MKPSLSTTPDPEIESWVFCLSEPEGSKTSFRLLFRLCLTSLCDFAMARPSERSFSITYPARTGKLQRAPHQIQGYNPPSCYTHTYTCTHRFCRHTNFESCTFPAFQEIYGESSLSGWGMNRSNLLFVFLILVRICVPIFKWPEQ